MSRRYVRLFEEQAASRPERPAVVGEDGCLTYAELEILTGRVAQALGTGPRSAGTPVAVLVSRGTLQLAALLGILRAGAPYVCLDADQPEGRLTRQLADSGASVLLADRPWAGPPDVIMLKDLPEAAPAPSVRPTPEDLAYVLYTSGSTGAPKGVAVTHRGLANYCRHVVGMLDCGARPGTFATVTGLSTDLGNTAVFPALVSGGCVHVVPTDVARDPVDFAEYMQTHAIDYLKITPSHLAALLEYPDPGVLPRQALLLGSETSRWDLVDSVHQLGGCRIVNHYGPTETTIGSLAYEVGRADPHRGCPTVPIGHPIRGTGIHVVDDALRPVPQGTAGELLICGPGLARGYWRSPRATEERFVTLDDGTRAYRTGDRVRRLHDGAVEFLGRVDLQVKIRGHRVEPAEVEAVLHDHPQVSRAAVVAVNNPGDGTVLAGYVVPADGARPTQGELRGHLAELPAHLVPARITVVDQLPFLPSGKVDRTALAQRGAAADPGEGRPHGDR